MIATTLPAAEGVIDFGNLQEINGGLSVRDCPGLTSLIGSQIGRITGELTLINVTRLALLGFPRLTEVDFLTLNEVPDIGGLDFSAEGKDATGLTVTETVIIIDTLLPSLGPLNLRNVSTLAMWNNTAMETISLPLQVVREKINIKSEGKVEFPLLPIANNITLRDVSSVSLPALTSVSDFLASGNITRYATSLQRKDVSSPFYFSAWTCPKSQTQRISKSNPQTPHSTAQSSMEHITKHSSQGPTNVWERIKC